MAEQKGIAAATARRSASVLGCAKTDCRDTVRKPNGTDALAGILAGHHRIRFRRALRLLEARSTALTPLDLTTTCEDRVCACRLVDEGATEEDPR